jgi:uncharacterized protein YjcR
MTTDRGLEDVPEGVPLADIAAAYGVTIRQVRAWVQHPRAPQPDDATIARMYRAGEPASAIAEAAGLGPSQVRWIVQRLGLERRLFWHKRRR